MARWFVACVVTWVFLVPLPADAIPVGTITSFKAEGRYCL
jgi:hypothetical protein